MTLNTLLAKPQPKRDRWGRYVIPDPVTGQERSWTRATTVAKTLSDDYHLGAWAERMVAAGIGRRSDLYALAASASIDDRDTLQKIAREAKAAAQSSARANLGTALHAFTERLDRGEEVNVPAEWAADVEAYKCTLGDANIAIDADSIEQLVTLHDLGIAGMLDRRAHILGGLAAFIADLKTGSYLDWQAFCIQLAIYAHADSVYNLATGEHEPCPPVDQDRALVIHLPAGTGTCSLYWVDIAAGWEAVQHAVWVREWRKRKYLSVPIAAPKDATPNEQPPFSDGTAAAPDVASGVGPSPRSAADPAAIYALRERALRIAVAGHEEQLRHYWPQNAPGLKSAGLTADHLAAIGRLCADIEREHSLPWPDVAAAPEYVAADDPRVVELIERLKRLPVDLSGYIATQVKGRGWPKLTSGRLTPEQLADIAEYTASAERARGKRVDRVGPLLESYAIDEAMSLLSEVGSDNRHTLTAEQVGRLEVLLDGIDRLMLAFTYEGERPVLMSTERAEAEILARHETKMKAVSAAREEAGRRGRKKPRTVKELTADPVLVAALTLPGINEPRKRSKPNCH